METTEVPKHIGRKIARIRELRGLKQEALAVEMGISQQAISKIEQSEEVEKDTLERVAKALGVSPQAIENFSDQGIFNYFNNFHDHSSGFNYHCTFNPIEKIVELYDEKVALLERLFESEREKVEMLKKGK